MTAAENDYGYPPLPGFDKRNRALVYAMWDAGWTGRRTSKGHWLALAPDGTTKITVPSKDGNNRGFANAHAQFMRWVKAHATPEIQEVWDAALETDDPLLKDVLAESIVRKQTRQIVSDQMERKHKEFIEAMKNDPRVEIVPLVRPWMARKQPGKRGGVLYASEAVLERVWPTGETDYACAFEGCEYTGDNPRGVAAHYGKAHTLKGESEPAGQDGAQVIDPTYTEPTTTRDYRPTERLVTTLGDLLESLRGMDIQEMAVAILTWMHDRPDIDHEPRTLIPLTDRQVLDRIRLLVGQPDQTDTIERLTRERDEATARLLKVETDIAALRDILDGVGK